MKGFITFYGRALTGVDGKQSELEKIYVKREVISHINAGRGMIALQSGQYYEVPADQLADLIAQLLEEE